MTEKGLASYHIDACDNILFVLVEIKVAVAAVLILTLIFILLMLIMLLVIQLIQAVLHHNTARGQ